LARLGIITGLAREAACFSSFSTGNPLDIVCAGPGPARAASAAKALIDGGCTGLLSFGLAGGLAPGLGPGQIIVANTVIGEAGKTYQADIPWGQKLHALLKGHMSVRSGAIAGSVRAVATAVEKQALFDATGALAVDMESHAVAAIAEETELPFLAVRCIADPALRDLPGWLAGVIDDAGRVRPRPILKSLLARPWILPGLLGLASEERKARAALRRVALLAGPGFGLLD